MNSETDFLATIQSVLLRCWVIGFGVLTLWLLAILGLGETILWIHSSIFGITKHELDLIMYCGMGLWKLVVFLCFFLPWLSIKMVRKQ